MADEKTESKKINEKMAYMERMKKGYGDIIDKLEISDMQKHFLRSRWLDQVFWMEGRANSTQWYYYRLRLTTIIGGVIVPVLVSLNFKAGGFAVFIKVITVIIGLLVAMSAAVEEFFNFGERWRHYRRTVETLKTEGWRFFQLSNNYEKYYNHANAYPTFADRTESIIQQDVEVFITEIVKEKKEKEEKPGDNQQKD